MGSIEQIVLDTHVLLWWISDPDKIPVDTTKKIELAKKNQKLLVSSISVWEIFMLVKGNRLELTMNVDDWMKKVESLPYLRFIPIDNAIAKKSVTLTEPIHDDPADRIIIATSLQSEAILITKDKKMLSYSHVKTFWK